MRQAFETFAFSFKNLKQQNTFMGKTLIFCFWNEEWEITRKPQLTVWVSSDFFFLLLLLCRHIKLFCWHLMFLRPFSNGDGNHSRETSHFTWSAEFDLCWEEQAKQKGCAQVFSFCYLFLWEAGAFIFSAIMLPAFYLFIFGVLLWNIRVRTNNWSKQTQTWAKVLI